MEDKIKVNLVYRYNGAAIIAVAIVVLAAAVIVFGVVYAVVTDGYDKHFYVDIVKEKVLSNFRRKQKNFFIISNWMKLEGCSTLNSKIMVAKKYGCKKRTDFVTWSLKKLYGRHLTRLLRKRLASRLRKNVKRTEVTSENDISDVVCAALRQVLRDNKRMPASKTCKCYACQKPGQFARECRAKHKGSYSTSPTRNVSEGASEISHEQALN
uniref:CCHC-type domain-containing protein n=1 Tax=Glossina pallidipes TaxID=7398 RepID=A0A1B0AEI3_GLOPL